MHPPECAAMLTSILLWPTTNRLSVDFHFPFLSILHPPTLLQLFVSLPGWGNLNMFVILYKHIFQIPLRMSEQQTDSQKLHETMFCLGWNHIFGHGCLISRRWWQTSTAFICMCDLWLSLTVQPTTSGGLWAGDNCWHTATHRTHWFAHAEVFFSPMSFWTDTGEVIMHRFTRGQNQRFT